MFSRISSRLNSEVNPLYRLRDQLQAQGHTLVDLISGNVNEHGIVFPQDILDRILVRASRRCTIYRPDSFGQKAAREVISAYYQHQGVVIPPDNILLTPGTSMAYWYGFKLLADEGEEILCPSPSYPLFDYIAALSGIGLVPYRLQEARRWSIDLNHLEASISTKTRALVLISPHNPTGHVSSAEEIAALAGIARRHDLAIISDEVFSEFLLTGNVLPRPAAGSAPLVLTLNGLSKMFALPGIKLGWMAVSGERERVGQALRALELISDTFLPVNEIMQAAVPEVFQEGRAFALSYAAQIRERWGIAQEHFAQSPRCSFIPPEGGFYVTLRLEDLDEERAAQAILRENHLLVHPGYYYDMAPDHLVLSFVSLPDMLDRALAGLLRTLERCSNQA